VTAISTHVLDTALGAPAAGVRVTLERIDHSVGYESATSIGTGVTDFDGRLRDFGIHAVSLSAGTHRLRFDVGAYFAATRRDSFYPEVIVLFTVRGDGHYHVPLLLSPYGYSTYRGS
jgi:5-hydroxyisourate hydrolase